MSVPTPSAHTFGFVKQTRAEAAFEWIADAGFKYVQSMAIRWTLGTDTTTARAMS